ncbi:MAG: NAD-dependent epimerase/dehydratase family protein [Flavobacterium sp.]|nr:MAG: NAD-dependent epimerase/dehydratase family protein [Flavobacterium sp.]
MKHLEQGPEIWAGIECTINRVMSDFIDQLQLNGHYTREDDIDAIASLGITQLRYPVLWEKHQPEKNAIPDFSWAAKNLDKLFQLGVKPIVGLVHHGSGPAYTNLLDPDFPKMLANYASLVANRFPWVEYYTPVNEPLTTARFSGLYGLWFPHEKNDVSFAKMLLNQLKGVVLSMEAIRKVNPDAKLIQTEDLGKTYSTPLLKYQANWENKRRFLTYDILCGKVIENHPVRKYFRRLGIPDADLDFFVENPCPPDIIGVNHYVTSERYLDHNLRRYPKHTHGGNTIHEYADVEAIRIRLKVPSGFSVLMKEIWKRYKIPVAVTEAHLHCSREEQMKWFRDIYEAASKLKADGMDVRAVTVWSVLGAFGWNKLLTENHGEYERGTFDISSGKRRPTAMAEMIKALCATGKFEHHLLETNGWWKRNSRFFFGRKNDYLDCNFPTHSRPILIIGKTGTLGRAFSRISNIRSLHHVLLGRDEADICNSGIIEKAIQKYNPWAIVNAAGYVRVDEAESDETACFHSNSDGPAIVAEACARHGLRFLTFSSDLVFDGSKTDPFLESDSPNPLNIYGKSKFLAEQSVKEILPDSLIIRTSAFFGPWDHHNFVHGVLHALSHNKIFHASNDIVSPTYVPDLVNAALDLLIDNEQGIWHLCNTGAISWKDFAIAVASKAGLNTALVHDANTDLSAKRPSYSAMRSEKGVFLPALEKAIDEYFAATRFSKRKALQMQAQNS